MLNLLKFLSIFAYTVSIFFFSNYYLAAFAIINIAAMIITKTTPLSALKYLGSFLSFIIFACIFNLILGYVEDAINLALRLLLIGNITQCYKKAVGASELTSAIELLFSPLKIFKIDCRDIGLMVCISLAFLPILRRDFNAIRMALRAKGMRLSSRSFKYVLKPFFIGILQRTNGISRALRIKGYE
ncbi:MAG: energy-coupling factor transporter transmembrane protein EcfT [Spirochaetaceae bacterium]|jgi:energy-coupling factor transport system permease protein|nr:energy-coupling factor transporter transmembrane protein EcfT [Spirochaetaceae bacterium]